MADRFPSLEDIDAGQTDVRDGNVSGGGDFLARERAALGEDADLFSSENDTRQTTVEDGDDDLLGGDFSGGAPQTSAGQGDDLDAFESSFPAMDNTNDNIGPGGTITGSNLPYHPPTTSYTSGYAAPSQTEESEPIRAWRESRDADIARRDEASAHKKEETVNTARKDIDSFYESYNRKVDRQKTQTAKEAEEFLAKREDTTSGGTSWERIAKLADLSGKGHSAGAQGSSKQKMRELLLDLSKDPNAPGATGV
ncbi:Clathrin light chain [Lithohypha guttulata]|uniref:Clathrin light chain n=1 Tax=Lithohypha guttulata TaxID=1690604 RepID=A0AAN7Y5A2_9EURO|nr:Clathrin light chain [Lithohypha guttulata]